MPAYDDGVALRMRVAARAGRRINGEAEWKMPGNPLAGINPIRSRRTAIWFATSVARADGNWLKPPLRIASAIP
jgi:hypothetical protein